MNENIAVKAENLSKMYKLYEKPVDRLKESINPFRKKYHREFYALKDVSFEVKKGETVGIIGKNGSGKSTLLKIITGVLTPTEGDIFVNGKVSALLELGAGFNLELTGMENIYLNGLIMGYTKQEMDGKLYDILSFADIGDFIYQPVKMYSSGMFSRLAFAVAINVDPEILVIDEALSVGDAFFQNKCFHKFDSFKEMGRTILFVSHDMGSVKQLCSRVLWLDKGTKADFGDKYRICAGYTNHQIEDQNKNIKPDINHHKSSSSQNEVKNIQNKLYPVPQIQSKIKPGGTGQAEIVSFFIKDNSNGITSALEVEKEYTFHIVANFRADIENVIFGFILENLKGIQILGLNSFICGKIKCSANAGVLYEAVFKLLMPKIQKGEYLISPAVASGTQKEHVMLCWYHNLQKVRIENEGYNISLIELDSKVEIIKRGVQENSCYS